MADYIKSAVGGEVTDQSFISTGPSRPSWLLTPLPLNQLDLTASKVRGRPTLLRTLHSLCLSSISQNFHLFSPSDLSTLPPLTVQRILARVRTERGYEDPDERAISFRPDEATVWAFSAVLDPEGTSSPSFTLGLPSSAVLPFLSPPTNPAHQPHPLVLLPTLFRSTSFQLITSLTLDHLDDASVPPLRYCTHLTSLWTRNSMVTDAGVRLLASSLELPGGGEEEKGRGIWRLRVWVLRGSRGVTDRSAKSLARWPGLVLLDLRETSCTSAFLPVYTRSTQNLLPALPPFQPCPDGLFELFSAAPPCIIIRYLAHTLLKPPGSDSSHHDSSAPLPYVALHIIPSTREIPPEHLPFPSSAHQVAAPSSASVAASSSSTSKTAFNSEFGTLYGTGVSSMPNRAAHFRSSVKYALHCEARDDYYHHVQEQGRRVTDKMRVKWGDTRGMTYKERDAAFDKLDKDAARALKKRKVASDERGRHLMGRVFRENLGKRGTAAMKKKQRQMEEEEEERAAAEADRRSKSFFGGRVSSDATSRGMEGGEVVDGERNLMLVRMSPEGWDRMQWATTITSTATTASSTSTATMDSRAMPLGPGASTGMTTKKRDLVGDILVASQRSSSLFRPNPKERPHSSPAPYSSSSSPPSSSPLPTPPPPVASANPFARPSESFKHGVRPLGSTTLSDARTDRDDDLAFSFSSTQSASRTLAASAPAAGGDMLGFASEGGGGKRRFAGEGAGGEVKRRGMKMFSGARLG